MLASTVPVPLGLNSLRLVVLSAEPNNVPWSHVVHRLVLLSAEPNNVGLPRSHVVHDEPRPSPRQRKECARAGRYEPRAGGEVKFALGESENEQNTQRPTLCGNEMIGAQHVNVTASNSFIV